ncbi:transcriptional attenuator, LytR family [Desulfitobacterium dehalogenans ATCC 51507]|uniref:Transcriptional attenuator, LytR family n=1 Tax=Desulfitobacterium dehalogenans (strain ATCC 51507 / DSM 9161 / JW/IU-DC1) TaxID=756499 RepID=I4AB37_DESDJ|nr:LCP family protein [Desulfitobacterium dehalogenans]AFM01172.1 transcriptional attenuator, LytR family [Desulfitobacterium dehalogenans ATCC 51507]
MDKKNIKNRLIHFIHAYGFNAVLGFGLGIAIVLAVFMISGRPGLFDLEARSSNMNRTASKEENLGKNQESFGLGEAGDLKNTVDKEVPEGNLTDEISNELALKDRVTVLLIGMDNRPGEVLSNTDTLMVASLDQKSKKMILLSIPRDTQVILNNKKEKVNAIARLQKGAISTQQYLQELIGAPIDGYVLTNFQGFKNIVDSLGGISLNVEKDMYYDTGDEQDRFINLKKGIQRLNGTQALQYARFRNDELADISRVSRQQEVIKAIVAEATTPRNIPKLPIIVPKIYQAIETNLNLGQIWALSMAFKNKETYEVINQTLPGQFSDEEGISYWKVSPKETKVILNQLFQGKTSPIFETIQKVNGPAKPPVKKETKPEIEADKVKDKEKDKNQDSKEAPITMEVLTTEANKAETRSQEKINTIEEDITFEILE